MFLERNVWMVFLLLFKDFHIYLFIFGCAGSSLMLGLSLIAASGSYSLAEVLGLLIVGASPVAGRGF